MKRKLRASFLCPSLSLRTHTDNSVLMGCDVVSVGCDAVAANVSRKEVVHLLGAGIGTASRQECAA